MAAGNTITVVGNITRDPELRFTASGKAVASFGLAHNHRRFNKQTNDWDEQTSFFDITVWGDMAENVAESIGKGARVIVEGRLEQQQWEDKKTGDNRSKVVIIADEVAPSLRWATCSISRVEKSDNGGSSRGGGSRGSSRGGDGDGRSAPNDEEPF